MYRKPDEGDRPVDRRPPSGPRHDKPEEPGRDTLPATFGSRLRARATEEAARQDEEDRQAAARREGEPDLTRWIVLAGAGAFVALFLAAAALFAFSRFREEPVALPTALDPTAVALAATATVPPTDAAPAETQPAAAPTIAPTPEPVQYTVQANDTLVTIATAYGVSVDEILAANPQITNPDLLVEGQVLNIPVVVTLEAQFTPVPTFPPGGTVEPTAGTPGEIPPSIFEGDLEAAYPLTLAGERVTIHYQRGSFTDQTGADIIAGNADEALAFIEERLGVTYTDTFDLYLAGSRFDTDPHLRGLAQSTQYRAFVLFDGTGTPAERRYMLTHEMTHVVAWNTYGMPSTILLSEGLATYSGEPLIEQSGYISERDFCRALVQQDRLPSLASIQNSRPDFRGHILSLYNYYTAGCFVAFLFDSGGPEAFAKLYPTSNYTGNYGVGLGQLEAQFRASLQEAATPLAFDPKTLVDYYDEVRAGYQRLFLNANPDQQAYLLLDNARQAVMSGDFTTARARLDEFKTLVP